MNYKIKFTLCGYNNGEPHVVILGKHYVNGFTYDVSEEVCSEMLALSGFKPFGAVQVALDAYHKQFGLTP